MTLTWVISKLTEAITHPVRFSRRMRDKLTKRYSKYDGGDPIHWKWYEGNHHKYKTLVDTTTRYFEEKGTVLDIGSGDGKADSVLINRGFTVIGVEAEEAGCQIAYERVPELIILNSKVENLKFTPKVDYLYSLNTIEHLKSPGIFRDLMKYVKKFAIVVTDDADIMGGGYLHREEFTSKTLANLFDGFHVEPIDTGAKGFIGVKVFGDLSTH